MGEAFFTEVPGPIPFGGLDSDDPLAFKVYEPDRLVLGKRMEDHLRIGVCLWHSFAWAGHATCSASGRSTGRGSHPAVDPMDGGPPEDGGRVRVHREARRARTTASTTATSRPRAHLRRVPRQPRRAGRRRRSATRSGPGVTLLWGTANLFTHPRYQAGAATNPDPEVFAYAAAQVKHMLEVTQAPRRHELRPVGRPRGLRHAAQHGPQARGRPARPVPAPRRRAQAPDRLRRARS